MSLLLQKIRMVPVGATDAESGKLVFPVDEVVDLIQDFKTAIPLHDVPEYLGACKRQIEILYREGFLTPLVPRTGLGSVRTVVFSKRNLNGILRILEKIPLVEDCENSNFHTMSYACQRGAGTFENVLMKVISEETLCRRKAGEIGIGQTLVQTIQPISLQKSA